MTTTIRKLIKADGTETDLIGPTSLGDVRKMIGAESLDVVSLRHMGTPLHVMLVDDRAYTTTMVQRSPGHFESVPLYGKKPVNEKATALYHANCRPGTLHKILGDVVVMPDEDAA